MGWVWASIALAWLSAFLLINPKTRKNETVLAVTCVAVIASIWIEKGIGLVITGFIPSPLGEISRYAPTTPEIAISAGIYALGFLILTILFKIAVSVKKEVSD